MEKSELKYIIIQGLSNASKGIDAIFKDRELLKRVSEKEQKYAREQQQKYLQAISEVSKWQE